MSTTYIRLLSGKIHRASVTSANLNYIGSIGIDALLLDKAGIFPLEAVEVCNLNNGNRWSTYVLSLPKGCGEICPNGGGALLAKPGDILIIWSYASVTRESVLENGHTASVVLVDQNNKPVKSFQQKLINQDNEIIFENGVNQIKKGS